MQPKNRISALDWARTEAYKQLLEVVSSAARVYPLQWQWVVGKLNKGCYEVMVSIDNREGLLTQNVVSLMLTKQGMHDEAHSMATGLIRQMEAVRRQMRRRAV